MKGRDSLKAMVKWVHSSMSDMKTEKLREAANEDYVYSWMRYTGTTDGSMGIAKGPYDMESMEISKYKDGKVVEHWGFMEMQDMMKMMPQPEMNMNTKDTGTRKKQFFDLLWQPRMFGAFLWAGVMDAISKTTCCPLRHLYFLYLVFGRGICW